MDKIKKWHNECMAKEMVEILSRNAYDTHYADNLDEAKNIVLNMIPKGSSVSLGGSVTLEKMDMVNIFRNGEYSFFDRYQNKPFEEIVEIYRQSLLADFLVTSTNAVTKAGELVNIDCSGNRVAGMIFGPRRVIVVVGVNKFVDNLEDAFNRLKKIAPLNCKRVGHKTPCIETGNCEECNIQHRMCNYMTVINHGRKFPGRISVVVVAEEAGY